MSGADTICARATPPGRGGVAVIRLSGAAVTTIGPAVLGGPLPPPRRAAFRRFLGVNGEILDEGLALYFPEPASFTGEDILELQGHGGNVVVARLMSRLTGLGAREARPGEFSERAFLNGRLDLTRAEAIADLVDARSEAGARAAMRSLSGVFARIVDDLVDAVMDLRAYVEAAIDFPDEEVDFLADADVAHRLADLEQRLATTRETAGRGRVLRDGMTVVIAGRPNAGKSSLLNQLAGEEAAIVTPVPGTTRDALREHITIDGMPLRVVDTAGLRESEDPVEQEGIRRAWGAIESCDRVLMMVDDAAGITEVERAAIRDRPFGTGLTLVYNKVDLTGRPAGVVEAAEHAAVAVSARNGDGMAALREHLTEVMGYADVPDDFSARRRHVDALDAAGAYLERARRRLDDGAGELVAEELRGAQQALGEITGQVGSEDLLGRIFSGFCIGK